MRFIYALLLILAISSVQAQQVFEKSTLAAAQEKAKAKNLLLLVQAGPANAVVFKQPALLDSLKKYCVSVVLTTDKDRAAFRAIWKESRLPYFAYLSPDGDVQAKCDSVVKDTKIYQALLAMAWQHYKDAQWLSELEADYKQDSRNLPVVEELIRARAKENLPIDSLLDEYVDLLPGDSLQSPDVLRFIALQAPVLDTKANQVLRSDANRFLLIWNALPLSQRVGLNNKIINKTIQQAIVKQDLQEAFLAATFAANTNGSVTAKNRAFDGNMMEYYYGVGDTARFLQIANTYYDRYLMTVPTDSLRHTDSLKHTGLCRFYAVELEKGARRVYTFSKEARYLNKAVLWAGKSIALYEMPANLDAYARLAYYTGDHDMAVAEEKKAIALAKQNGLSVKELEGVLQKMQAGNANIDPLNK